MRLNAYALGKSGRHRAGQLLTAAEGDLRESATEIYRRGNAVRVERRGKSSPEYGRPYCHVNPVRRNVFLEQRVIVCSAGALRRRLERFGDDSPR